MQIYRNFAPAHKKSIMLVTPQKERLNRTISSVLTGVIALAVVSIAFVNFYDDPAALAVSLPLAAVLSALVYLFLTRKYRRRRQALKNPFHPEREAILKTKVAFYNVLTEEEKDQFRQELTIFLNEKRITGIKTDVDETTRILVAASAIIPIFGYPEWEYDGLGEVLIYPSMFDDDFQFDSNARARIQGMVSSGGTLSRIMILSKPDLHRGFENPADKHNVGIHEFAHLMDRASGAVDGIPATLDTKLVEPWLKLIHGEMKAIAKGESDIRPYALTNEQEFFAVASEYFFESPAAMARKHPELYRMLERIFKQDMKSKITSTFKSMLFPYGKKIGRNDSCPCGSGKKYKKCCMD